MKKTSLQIIGLLCIMSFHYTAHAQSGQCADIAQAPAANGNCNCIGNAGCPGTAVTTSSYYFCTTSSSGYLQCTCASQKIETQYTCVATTSNSAYLLCISRGNFDPCCWTTCTKPTTGTDYYACVATGACGCCPQPGCQCSITPPKGVGIRVQQVAVGSILVKRA